MKFVFAAVVLLNFFSTACSTAPQASEVGLVGAWRGNVQFTTGAFAAVKDLEFMYVFHADGTLTESSNYDGAPPAPPASGVWRKVGARQFEARYEFYWTKPPANFDEIAKGGGWTPGGHGVLAQKLSLSADGSTFDSTIKLEVFDPQGKLTEPGSAAAAHGRRMKF